MKISYRKLDGIKIVETVVFRCKISNESDERTVRQLHEKFKQILPHCKKIIIISKTLGQSILDSSDKMIRDDVWNNMGKVGRGHWRLQPFKKDGEWTYKMIWINDFEKQGYTRKAGILKTFE